MAKRQVSIFINGRAVENTLKSIKDEKRKINRELQNMVLGTEEYQAKAKELDRVNGILDAHRKKVNSVGDVFGKITSGAVKFAGVAGIAFGVTEIISYGKRMFELNTQMEQLNRKAAIVFGQALPSVSRAAKENATQMGLTEQKYVSSATALGDLLIPMGLQRQEAADISVELVNLSGALAEWTGGQKTSEEVSQTLAKALLGEREELKQLGISIKESDVQNRLREKGLDSLTGKYLEQAKAVATLELITEKSVDAQTAYADNSDSLIRRQAELSAKIEQIQQRIATALLPVLERLFSVVEAGADLLVMLSEKFDVSAESSRRLVDSVFAQQTALEDLESAVNPLLDRHDELTAKTSLSNEEQDELAEIIRKVGQLTPFAVTELDKYGNALAINTEQARAFVKAEKARLQFVNGDAIGDIEKQIEILEERRNKAYITANSRGWAFTEDRIMQAREEMKEISLQIEGAEAELARLKGTDLPTVTDPEPVMPPVVDDEPEVDLEAEARAEQQRKAYEKEQEQREKHLLRLGEMAAKYREEQRLSALSDEDRQLEEIRIKYQQQIDLARELEASGFQEATALRLELEQLRDEELTLQQQEFDQARRERLAEQEQADFEAEMERYRTNQERRQEIEAEIDAKIRETVMSEREVAILELEQYYEQLIAEAQRFGLDTLELEIVRRNELARVNKEYDEKDLKQTEATQKAKVEVYRKAFGALADVVSNAQALLVDSQGRALGAGKILALIQIGIKSAEALASSAAAAAAVPFPGNLGAIASSVATVLGVMGQARAALNGTPAVPQYKDAGWVNVKGQDDHQTYRAKRIGRPHSGMLPSHPVLIDSITGSSILGSERGSEYFVSHEDLQKPAVFRHVSAIESLTRQRAEGGFSTADGTAPSGLSAGNALQVATGIDPLLMTQAMEVLGRLLQVLEGPLYAVIDDETVVDLRTRFNEINAASGGVLG